jgi:hypothetical protein
VHKQKVLVPAARRQHCFMPSLLTILFSFHYFSLSPSLSHAHYQNSERMSFRRISYEKNKKSNRRTSTFAARLCLRCSNLGLEISSLRPQLYV